MIGFTRPSVQAELDRFYKSLSTSSTSFESISKSAFTQARKKLDPSAFIELSHNQLVYFEQNALHQKRWKENRIVAVDGSLLNLPHCGDVEKEFGSVTNQHDKVVSARCSFAFDVCNQLVLDSKIAPRRSCEKDLAAEHLASLNPETDILILDRGYPCQWLMGLLSQKRFRFCFRLSTSWKEAHRILDRADDADWTMVKDARREWGKLRKYGLTKTLEGLRLVSLILPSGEREVLVTNLDRKNYQLEDLKELYHLRWGVEECYKSFKKTLHIEHFSGRTARSIMQDFYARVLMLNMASMVRSQGVEIGPAKTSENLYRQQSNKTQVVAKIKDFLIDIFYSNKIKKMINQLLKILLKRKEIIRPNRSFDRPNTASRRRSKIINNKGI